MAKIGAIQEVAIADLTPYECNAKTHSPEQVAKIADSIREFGFISPCLIDKDKNIIAGHGRIMAAKELGLTDVPCLYIEGLSDAQKRAYILADNRLTELGGWDMEMVEEELAKLCNGGFDVSLTGFDFDIGNTSNWFENREKNDTSHQEGNDEYNAFLDKFEQPKTTDDCYTPDNVYEAIKNWAIEHYGLQGLKVVRPFYPGGDYQKETYTEDSVVIDNPPFSIISDICRWYKERGIKFFMFAPALTLFSTAAGDVNYLPCDGSIVYENGATVDTSFVTNLGEYKIETVPDLFQIIKTENQKNVDAQKANLPKYEYPPEVVSGVRMQYLSVHGVSFKVRADEVKFIRALDSQKEHDKAIYGAGFLISEEAGVRNAAAKAQAELNAAQETALLAEGATFNGAKYVWSLSEREREIIKNLGKKSEVPDDV